MYFFAGGENYANKFARLGVIANFIRKNEKNFQFFSIFRKIENFSKKERAVGLSEARFRNLRFRTYRRPEAAFFVAFRPHGLILAIEDRLLELEP